jgi:hypothetical protein
MNKNGHQDNFTMVLASADKLGYSQLKSFDTLKWVSLAISAAVNTMIWGHFIHSVYINALLMYFLDIYVAKPVTWL